MISQPIRAICILLAILVIASCNNSADKTQPFEATALSQPSPRRQWPFGDKPVPAGDILVASNYRTVVAFRSIRLRSKIAKDAYGHSKQIVTYPLSELPNPAPDNFVGPSSDRYSTSSFLGRVLLHICGSRQIEQ